MTLFLILTGTVAYLGVALGFMRPLYGRWRAASIDNGRRNHPILYRTVEEGVAYFEDNDRGFIMTSAAMAGLVWPTVLPVWAVLAVCSRVMGSTTVRSQLEQQGVVAAQAKRIAELERELGIGGAR